MGKVVIEKIGQVVACIVCPDGQSGTIVRMPDLNLHATTDGKTKNMPAENGKTNFKHQINQQNT